jgi:hypothetical protein
VGVGGRVPGTAQGRLTLIGLCTGMWLLGTNAWVGGYSFRSGVQG